MTSSFNARAEEYLRQALQTPSARFREGQLDAIRDVVRDRKRLLLVRRTGWGKSMVYFIATRMLRDQGGGPTLLISPLLSLMRNQIEAANRIGLRAETINSSNTDEWRRIERDIKNDRVDLLLISPERLSNEQFREDVLSAVSDRISLFVVDEAHCISDWGHDFRPDYLRITRVLQALPRNVAVLATTATANGRVVNDVVQQVGGGMEISRGPLARASLRLQNMSMDSPTDRMAWLAQHLPSMRGSGIIYTLTVRDADRVAEWLQLNGIDAKAYSGRLPTEEREQLEQELLDNDVKALVSTVALGMGFDKPDLGFVIHYQRPGSVVHYYQQVGRAGRDGNEALGILMHGREDDDIIDFFIRNSFPPEEHVDDILGALEAADDGLKGYELEQQVNIRRSNIYHALKLLSVRSPQPVVKRGTKWYRTPVPHRHDRQKVEAIKQIRRQEQREMQRYVDRDACLMAYLQDALDDPYAQSCGTCAPCREAELVPTAVDHDLAVKAASFLRRSEIEVSPRKRWPYTDAFSTYGWKSTMAQDVRAEEGRALSIWGDAGWGHIVKQGKQVDGRFSDQLVEAARTMIQKRWRPEPAPAWVTCIPSSNHPELVPDFARRLADALGLPFVECIRKVRDNEPQKTMENTHQQASNLDGVFAVDAPRTGPVLLVDDTIDSGWTMTVAAALLRQQGSGSVRPFALASTAPTSS